MPDSDFLLQHKNAVLGSDNGDYGQSLRYHQTVALH